MEQRGTSASCPCVHTHLHPPTDMHMNTNSYPARLDSKVNTLYLEEGLHPFTYIVINVIGFKFNALKWLLTFILPIGDCLSLVE